MGLVKEATMKPRTRALGSIGAAATVAGVVIALAVGGDSAATSGSGAPTTTVTSPVSMPMSPSSGMGSMMTDDPAAMAAWMANADMSQMHSAMHEMMRGAVPDDVLAACDQAHLAMPTATGDTTARTPAGHDAHHEGTGS
mgnify:FL=1|jgi:hypothetical protein